MVIFKIQSLNPDCKYIGMYGACPSCGQSILTGRGHQLRTTKISCLAYGEEGTFPGPRSLCPLQTLNR